MSRAFTFILATGVALSASVHSGAAAERPTSNDRTDRQRLLRDVLQAEQRGSVKDRTRRLKPALQADPDFAPARWQSGEVRFDGRWLGVERAAARLKDDVTLAEYRRLREATPRTVAGQLRLAAWCGKHKLADRRRAHLTAVLELDPNHRAAREALGHVRIGPFWYSKRELKRRAADAKQAAKDLKRWAPTINALRKGLTSGKRGPYERALKRLKGIDDPSAIETIELGLAYHSPQLAMVVIDYLGEKPNQEATLALARQGIFSPWKTPRKAAAGKLKTRKFEHFVPQVLALTSTPVRSRRLLYIDSGGSVFYRQFLVRENRNLRVSLLRRFDQIVRRVPLGTTTSNSNSQIEVQLAGLLRNARTNARLQSRTLNDVAQRARESVLRDRLLVEETNRVVNAVNRRVGSLLEIITNRRFNDDVEQYWKWWDEFTAIYHSEEKSGILLVQEEVRTYEVPQVTFTTSSGTGHSCLAAGTPVWTDRGPVAVEKVRVGDRVLSQNVETGELAFKPVLKTTVRPPAAQLKLALGGRRIAVTTGHPFWIAGKGWMKARDIKAGMLMHDVTGATEVHPAGPARKARAYNLIVADFHTYFVGESKVLSHDNTPIEPTDVLVPGLARK